MLRVRSKQTGADTNMLWQFAYATTRNTCAREAACHVARDELKGQALRAGDDLHDPLPAGICLPWQDDAAKM